MSRVVEGLPPKLRSGPVPKYPWDEWMDGQVREITQDEDFDVPVRSMAAQVRQHGVNYGVPAIARVRGRSVVFQFLRPEAQ